MAFILHADRHRARHIFAPNVFDPGECDIDAGAHTRAGPHVAVDHPPGLRDPARVRSQRRHVCKGRFVGGRLAAVEDPRACDEARARADGDEVAQRRVHGAQEVELGPQVRRACAPAARHKQDVQRRMAGQGVGGHDTLADGGTGVGGHEGGGHEGGDRVEGAGKQAEAERLRLGESVECVERAEDVEGLEAGEEEATDGYGGLVSRHGESLFGLFSLIFSLQNSLYVDQ